MFCLASLPQQRLIDVCVCLVDLRACLQCVPWASVDSFRNSSPACKTLVEDKTLLLTPFTYDKHRARPRWARAKSLRKPSAAVEVQNARACGADGHGRIEEVKASAAGMEGRQACASETGGAGSDVLAKSLWELRPKKTFWSWFTCCVPKWGQREYSEALREIFAAADTDHSGMRSASAPHLRMLCFVAPRSHARMHTLTDALAIRELRGGRLC